MPRHPRHSCLLSASTRREKRPDVTIWRDRRLGVMPTRWPWTSLKGPGLAYRKKSPSTCASSHQCSLEAWMYSCVAKLFGNPSPSFWPEQTPGSFGAWLITSENFARGKISVALQEALKVCSFTLNFVTVSHNVWKANLCGRPQSVDCEMRKLRVCKLFATICTSPIFWNRESAYIKGLHTTRNSSSLLRHTHTNPWGFTPWVLRKHSKPPCPGWEIATFYETAKS